MVFVVKLWLAIQMVINTPKKKTYYTLTTIKPWLIFVRVSPQYHKQNPHATFLPRSYKKVFFLVFSDSPWRNTCALTSGRKNASSFRAEGHATTRHTLAWRKKRSFLNSSWPHGAKTWLFFFSSNGFSYTALLLQVSVLFWSASRSGALIQSAVLRPFASLHLLRIIVIHDSSNIAGILKAVGSSGAWRRCCCKWRSFRRRKHSCSVLFPSLFEVRHARVRTSFFCYCCLLCYCCVCTVHLSPARTNESPESAALNRQMDRGLFTSTSLYTHIAYFNMHHNH